MKIKKQNLLFLAGLIWLIAGINILKIGIVSYKGYINILNIALSILVFCLFWFMIFFKLVKKHTLRISLYEEERQFFLKFFDKKSFIIMAVMMTLGISLRVFHLVPTVFIAVFYTGLGSALTLAGILFFYNYFKFLRRDLYA